LEADPDWIHDAAMCHFHLGRKQEALLGLDRAALLQPAYGYRFASRAWLRQALGDLAGARADYERAIALDPEDAISLNNLGLLEEQMGYRREARRRFEVADELRSVLESSGIAIEPSSDPSKDASAGLSAEIRDPLPAQPDPTRTPWSVGEFLRFVRNGFKLKP
jgi:tetratricopeptide (TPR) repeat protein